MNRLLPRELGPWAIAAGRLKAKTLWRDLTTDSCSNKSLSVWLGSLEVKGDH